MEDKQPKATHSGILQIGGREIEAHVLNDGTRVLSERGVLRALDMTAGARDTEEKLPRYLRGKNIAAIIPAELKNKLATPLWFTAQGSSAPRKGLPATLLPEILDVWLKARDTDILVREQERTAKMPDILMRGLAHIGIIALVDEATGYQEIRDRQALKAILDKYITDELAKWTKTFPDEYYKELFRLKGIPYPVGVSGRKPSYIGMWTNDIVYKRIAPGVLDELKTRNPKNERGNPGHKLHQSLTRELGHPKLTKHLENVIFLMRGCTRWSDFERLLNRTAPKFNATLPLDFPVDTEKEPTVE